MGLGSGGVREGTVRECRRCGNRPARSRPIRVFVSLVLNSSARVDWIVIICDGPF